MRTRSLFATLATCVTLPAIGLVVISIQAGQDRATRQAVEPSSGNATATAEPAVAAKAQLFQGMGPHRRKITTDSPEAQRYFDQGLTWMYAFNHDEAIRSFTHAAQLDDDCAMAWWGVSVCQGPNYNDEVMTEERSQAAWEALTKARERVDRESPVERALIEALEHRYANPWPEDRSGLERDYAEAMAKVSAAYPDDMDVGTLYAEAMMVRRPWKLYSPDGKPVEDTETIVSVLERVMRRDPDHPGANHLYIHAVEPSRNPYRGLRAAHRLADLVPASGHLLHMPSHIYVKTGLWHEAIVQNRKAMASDARYRQLSPDQGLQHLYMVHNAHMRAYAAMMSGREREAMAAARAMWANVPEEVMREVGPIFDLWMCSVYDVQKRFGRWDAILDEPAPPEYLPVTTAIWRAHRAIALAAKKDFAAAEAEHGKFREAMAALPEDHMAFLDSARSILVVSDHFIAGEIELQRGNWAKAAEHLEQGAAAEDELSYGEPPQWLQPIRHTLGAVYLSAERYEDAARVYRRDLAKWPENGWSLYGLSRALRLQGQTRQANQVLRRHQRAWAHADAPIRTSCQCIPEI